MGHRYAAVSLTGDSSAVFGDVVHHHHHHDSVGKQVQSLTQLRPSSRLPFRRDRDFVEPPIFDSIYQCALQPAARVGVVGLGGIGKTQLVIEYAYRREKSDPQMWVFWVHASSAARFKQSYQQIAQQVHISGWADPNADVLNMVYTWLSDAGQGQWTMVVDNADSSDVVFGSRNGESQTIHNTSTSSENVFTHDRSIADYLPSSAHGSIVITSRSREVVEGLIEYAEDIFEVNPMAEENAVALLTRKLKSQPENDRGVLDCLARQLDYMPLAITQAAAYINQPGARMTVARYSEKLTLNDLDRDRLLAKDIHDPRRDREASNSIIMTWHTSFELLRLKHSSAARLLSLMSFFDRESIPEALLQGRYHRKQISTDDGKEDATDLHNADDFDEDIRILCVYGLINLGTIEKLFGMHRLVQYSTRKWLELHHEVVGWQESYIDIFMEVFPSGEYDTWPICRALFPHIEQVLFHDVDNKVYLAKRADVLFRAAEFARQDARYEVSRRMAETSLRDREKVFNEGSEVIAHSLILLSVVLQSQGKFDEAEQLSQRALASCEEGLGPHHPDTLACLNNLALISMDRGNYHESAEMIRRILAEKEKHLGLKDDDTLSDLNNLALVLYYQGKYKEAERIHRQVLGVREKQFGPDHPSTLNSLRNLARTVFIQGDHEAAEKMTCRALADSEKQLGCDHPDTLQCVVDLANMRLEQQANEEAFRLYDRAAQGFKQSLGVNHPMTQECRQGAEQSLRFIDEKLRQNSDT